MLFRSYFYRHDCHCEHCVRGFKSYLKGRFDAGTLEVDGVRLVDDAVFAAAGRVRASGRDAVLMAPTRFGLGFMLGNAFGAANPATAIGHSGAGGALAFADPASGVALAYVMNDMRFGATGDPRSEELVRAVYAAL